MKRISQTIRLIGLGQLSAVGQGRAALEAALRGYHGSSGDGPAGVGTRIRRVKTSRGEVDVPVYQVPEVTLPANVPESVRRRMPRISAMLYAAVLEAIWDAFGADAAILREAPERVGLVVGTSLGCLDSANTYQKRVILEGPAGTSPTLFASSVQNAMASHLSISCGMRGPTSTVTTMEQSAFGAFRLAVDWMEQEMVDHAIVVAGDELTDYSSYVVAHKPEIARTLQPRQDHCSVLPGEGVAAFVLSRVLSTGSEGRRGYCEIRDVQLFSEACPDSPRLLAAAYGARGQWSRYQEWVSRALGPRELECHTALFGSFLTCSALEVAVAALKIARDRTETTCIQLTDHGEAQTLTFGAC